MKTTNEDLRFNIAFKALDTTGIKASMKLIDNVLALTKKGTSLDNIDFSVFEWCGMNKVIIKVKG